MEFKNFNEEEFACQHWRKGIKLELVEKLQHLRDLYKKPIRVNSGYRCAKHPIESVKKFLDHITKVLQ